MKPGISEFILPPRSIFFFVYGHVNTILCYRHEDHENTIGMFIRLCMVHQFIISKTVSPPSLIPALKKSDLNNDALSVPLIMEKLYKSQIQAKFHKNKVYAHYL